MTDLISRADAIEAVKHSTAYMHDDLYEAISIRIPSAETTGALDDAIAKYVTDGLMELPSAEADWIPCSERLPDESGDYICTIPLDEEETYIDVLTFHKGRFYEDDDEWGATYHDDVLAWMPLPEPYREDGE